MPLIRTLCDISRITHGLIYRDTDESLCSRAWRLRDRPFWRAWVAVFGRGHCERSWRYYWRG